MAGSVEAPRVQPIKPEDILEKKIATIPNAILQAVNELIALNWDGRCAEIKRCEIFAKYAKISGSLDDRTTHDRLIDAHALDFEFAYQKEGWEVHYEYPGMGDSDFEPYYTFKVKNK